MGLPQDPIQYSKKRPYILYMTLFYMPLLCVTRLTAAKAHVRYERQCGAPRAYILYMRLTLTVEQPISDGEELKEIVHDRSLGPDGFYRDLDKVCICPSGIGEPPTELHKL